MNLPKWKRNVPQCTRVKQHNSLISNTNDFKVLVFLNYIHNSCIENGPSVIFHIACTNTWYDLINIIHKEIKMSRI